MHLFGRKKKETAAAPETAAASIAKLKDAESVLSKRQAVMQHKVDQEKAQIAKLLRPANDRRTTAQKQTDKKSALMCLKRQKMYEKNLDELDMMKMNLETQIHTLESAKMNAEVFKNQQAVAAGLKAIHGELDIDKVEDQQMDLQEQMDLAKEIGSALATPLTGGEIDDDDLMDELTGLEQELMDEEIADVGPATEMEPLALPTAPSGQPVIATPAAATTTAMTDEERELAELEASMA